MEHNCVRNDNFNILTIKREKGGKFLLSGETREPLDIGDYVMYIVNDKGDVLGVDKILERRDSKDFPKGNGMFYRAECSMVARPNPTPAPAND